MAAKEFIRNRTSRKPVFIFSVRFEVTNIYLESVCLALQFTPYRPVRPSSTVPFLFGKAEVGAWHNTRLVPRGTGGVTTYTPKHRVLVVKVCPIQRAISSHVTNLAS
jgi:hypothetical protein